MNVGERIGDYEIVAILGAGGMGQVYKVRNVISDRMEAMKVLLPNLGGDSALADRFLREIKVQATLDHPNIARLNTAQQLGNQLVMLMEYVEGSSIDTVLKSGPMELSDSLQCTSQVLDALSYAHARGVVHRDIKPANIMLTPSGVVKLMDFGIARMQADRPLTRTGTTVGSLFYMSPEQINGGLPDLRSDLYSLGVTLYEMVTGRRPFVGDSDYSIMAAHLQQKPVAPIEIVAGVPLDLNDIILMAISKEPDQRFQSAEAFHAALRNFAGSIGVTLGALPGIARSAPASMPQAAPATPSKTAAPVPSKTAGEQLAPTATGISVPVRPAPTIVPAPLPAFQAPPPPAPVFQGPVPPPPVLQAPPPPTKSGSRRGLYMALGSVATLLVLAAAIIEGPKLMHSGASSAATPVATPVAAESKAAESPVVPAPAPARSPTPDTQPAAAAPATPAPAQTPVEPAATPVPAAASQVPVRKPPVAAQQVPSRSPASVQPSVQRPPVEPPAAQQAPQQSSQQPPARPAASAQLNELRQEYNQVAIRVGAAKSGLRALQQQMQRQGVDMRGDMLEAESRMDYLMQESMGSMRAGDADSARTSLQMAERSLETIEKFLGR
jgi:serine/threonine-protein kinase